MDIDKIRTVDLFSGCGGMSLGFQNAGYKVLAAFDNWKPAVDVYKANFDHPIYDFDLGADESSEFIKELKPHYQEVIQMRYFQEMSYQEIATKIDEPLSNVKIKILRAKKLLAEIIQKGK